MNINGSSSNGFPHAAVKQEQESAVTELPEIQHDLLPFGVLVERVAGQAYADLHNLTEVLPSAPDAERKRLVLDYVSNAGRRLMRLAVIARWSQNSEAVRKCMNIVAFLGTQNYQIESAIEFLDAIHKILQQTSIPNYDLPTAYDLLTTGNYQRLPAVLKTTFAASEKLTDSQVLDILQQTNEAIRYRLAVSDHIPDDARSYTIANGRVLFTIPHQFQGSFTVGGSETTDPWHLLDINFLFNPTSSKDQQDLFKVEGPLHDRILDMGNHLLSEEAMAAAAATEGQQISMDKLSKDPLARVFNFLRDTAINLRMESLYAQALALGRSSGWSQNVSITMARDRKSFDVHYWLNAKTRSKLAPGAPAPTGSKFQVAIRTREAAKGAAAILQSLSLEDVSTADQGKMIVGLWMPESLDIPDVEGEILMTNASFEHQFLACIRKHCLLIMQSIHSNVAESILPQQLINSSDTACHLIVNMHALHSIKVQIDEKSGQLKITPTEATSYHVSSKIFQAAQELNNTRNDYSNYFVKIRSLMVADEIEGKAHSVGLESYRRPFFRSQDQALLPSGRYPLFFYLDASGSHVFMVLIGDANLTFHMVEIYPIMEASKQAFGIKAMGSISHAALGLPAEQNLSVSASNLKRLHAYALARCLSVPVERQLYSRRIDWRTVQPNIVDGSDNAAASARADPPRLLVKTSDFTADSSTIIDAVVSITTLRKSAEESPKVLFHSQVKGSENELEALRNKSIPGLEISSEQLYYTSTSLETCLEDFRVALCVLAEGLERVKEEKIE